MKKDTKDRIGKFLFKSLTKDQKRIIGLIFDRKSWGRKSPILKLKRTNECIKIEINLVPLY